MAHYEFLSFIDKKIISKMDKNISHTYLRAVTHFSLLDKVTPFKMTKLEPDHNIVRAIVINKCPIMNLAAGVSRTNSMTATFKYDFERTLSKSH